MSYTIIPVCYRDLANFTWYTEICLEGAITDAQVACLRASLRGGTHYAPVQVGLTHCGAEESSGFPGINDHGWHQMDLGGIEVRDERPSACGSVSGPDEPGTVAGFVERIQRAAASGWQPLLPA